MDHWYYSPLYYVYTINSPLSLSYPQECVPPRWTRVVNSHVSLEYYFGWVLLAVMDVMSL